MKIVCVLLACCLAVALANRTPEEDALLSKHLNECRTELSIPDPATLIVPGSRVPHGENATFGCLMFCMQKKRGLMNEHGTFNKEAILANIEHEAPARKEAFAKMLENCEKTVKPVEGCKMAACLVPGETNA